MVITASIQSEFDEQIAAFFQRGKSLADAQKQLDQHCNEMLAALPDMLSVLSDYPVYAGVAFYGKMQIADRKLVSELKASKTAPKAAVEAIRASKALKIAASAKGGWDFLLKNDQEALWNAIQLNALAAPVKKLGAVTSEKDEDDDDDDYDEDRNHESDDQDEDDDE